MGGKRVMCIDFTNALCVDRHVWIKLPDEYARKKPGVIARLNKASVRLHWHGNKWFATRRGNSASVHLPWRNVFIITLGGE